MTHSAEDDACRCVPDDEYTARDADTGNPQEYVRVPGFWGWFRSGWQDVVCPIHDATEAHASPQACSRCNPLACPCVCHSAARLRAARRVRIRRILTRIIPPEETDDVHG